MALALTLYDPGDEILVPNPGFVLYPPHAKLMGALPVAYDLLEEKGYQPDFEQLERLVTARTRSSWSTAHRTRPGASSRRRPWTG